jgi:hypothetical protein
MRFLYYANDFENPVSTDWPAPTLAPASADTFRPAIPVRRFDDVVEEGVGWYLTWPSNATQVSFDIKARAQTAPTQVKTVGNMLYLRAIPNAIGPSLTYISFRLNAMTMLSGNTSFRYKPRQTIPIPSLPVASPGVLLGWELSRVSNATNLVGDWDLVELIVEFA